MDDCRSSATCADRRCTQLLLLKTRSLPHDPYTAQFARPHYDPVFLPVLTHTPSARALAVLTALLRATPPFPHHGGLVITSQRAVEVLSTAISEAAHDDGHGENAQRQRAESWSQSEKTVFVVGPATGDAVDRAIRSHFPHWHVEGQDSGNGEALARHIMDSYATPSANLLPASVGMPTEAGAISLGHLPSGASTITRRAPLLFLPGETRRDTVPATLMAASLPVEQQVRVDELACYATTGRDSFPREFATALRDHARPLDGATPCWVIIFSPTHCESVLEALGWLGGGNPTEDQRQEAGVRVASIGPTTRDSLRDKFAFEVDVCTPAPSPEGVKSGIEDWTRRRKES